MMIVIDCPDYKDISAKCVILPGSGYPYARQGRPYYQYGESPYQSKPKALKLKVTRRSKTA